MDILPAVDLLDGKVVRLAQGRREQVTVYSDDPVAVASKWVEAGAAWLHVVDLNGAFDGDYINLPLAKRIIQSCKARVELSGGIRTDETLDRALEAGAARVVLGTKACEEPPFVQRAAARYGDRIAVAIDAKAGQVVSRGWVEGTGLSPEDLARRMRGLGVKTLVCTDVSRDGMLAGPNQSLVRQVLGVGGLQVIASGGVSSIDDIQELKALEPDGVVGAIIGKALYEGTVDLKAALALAAAPAAPTRRPRWTPPGR
jgi:phosphoribosylformimino-5-aminoimidazole carboxamide ribotide isomerase